MFWIKRNLGLNLIFDSETAIAIARTKVNGTLKKTAIETKYGKKVYAIEFEEASGVEKEVLVEIATGEVIAVEVQ